MAENFFEVMTEALNALAPGLKNIGPELIAESKRLFIQGQMEMANGMFNGSGFVPYGPGQYTPAPELDKGSQEIEPQQQQQQQERGGREM